MEDKNSKNVKCAQSIDFYYSNLDLDKYYDLCREGKKKSSEGKALRKSLKKRGIKLEPIS